MSDQKITDYTEVSDPEEEDFLEIVEDPTGTPSSRKASLARLFGTLISSRCEGRLTTESGVAVSSADRTAQSTLYFTPYKGNRVALHDGTRWKQYKFTELSLALSGLTSGKPYDVFLQDIAGTLTLVILVWTNDTTRATALALQDGVYVKTGATTQRYLGTIYTTGTTTTEDSAAKRYVWNYYHRVPRNMKNATETTNSWTYTTATLRQANAAAGNQLDYVVGVAEDLVEADVYALVSNSSSNISVTTGIGVDSTSANSAQVFGYSIPVAGTVVWSSAHYKGIPGVGRHFLAWLEYSSASGTTTWYGDVNLPAQFQSGIRGVVWA